MGDEHESLLEQVQEYESQLEQIDLILQDDPENEEYLGLKKEIEQLIDDVKSVLSDKKEEIKKPVPEKSSGLVVPKDVDVSKLAAELGLFVGLKVKALWPEDGSYYIANIDGIYSDGILVKYEGYNTSGKVLPEHIKIIEQKVAFDPSVTKKPESSSSLVLDMVPKHLRPLPTDDEKTREAKKKKIKAIKLKAKIEKTQYETNQSKLSWQNFLKKNSNKKAGSKRESMFRTSESTQSKVGVIGSGKGMTETKKQEYQPKKIPILLPTKNARKM